MFDSECMEVFKKCSLKRRILLENTVQTVERDILAGKDVGDGFGRFCHQRSLSFNISVWHQHLKDVTNIEIPSPRLKNCHQHLCNRKYSESL